jgi:hypothetical protein
MTITANMNSETRKLGVPSTPRYTLLKRPVQVGSAQTQTMPAQVGSDVCQSQTQTTQPIGTTLDSRSESTVPLDLSGDKQPALPPAPGYALKHTNQITDDWKQVYREWSQVGADVVAPDTHTLPVPELDFLATNGITVEVLLGSGGFGSVWRCRATSYDDSSLACKVLSLSKFNKRNRTVETAVNLVLNEGLIHEGLTHENIVQCRDVLYLSQPDTGFPFMRSLILMELCDGNLLDLMSAKPSNHLTEREAHEWFAPVVQALKYLHNQNVVHFDVKIRNIMYRNTGAKGLMYKLGDFGLSRLYPTGAEVVGHRFKGTKRYKAPEMPGNTDRANKYMAKPVDVYSLGVCLAECLGGHGKHRELLAKAKYMTEHTGALNMDISTPCADMLLSITEISPQKRLTVDGIQSHQWFQMY